MKENLQKKTSINTYLVVPLKFTLTPSLYQVNAISEDPYAIQLSINSEPSHTSGRWFTIKACNKGKINILKKCFKLVKYFYYVMKFLCSNPSIARPYLYEFLITVSWILWTSFVAEIEIRRRRVALRRWIGVLIMKLLYFLCNN